MSVAVHKDISERARQARKALTDCNLCPRHCGVDRTAGEKGFCRLDDTARYFREVLYFNEESELIPSYQIFFSGCNLVCEYCAVSQWNNQPWIAKEVDYDFFAAKTSYHFSRGAKTLNLLGGEPAVNIHGILELLSRIDSGIKVVWNSNMYYNNIVDSLLDGIVDIYLADLKCGCNDCSKKLLGADDYLEVVKRNILKAAEHADVIVRHILLPGHSQCCLEPILKWMKTEIPQVKLSLWGNYFPPVEAGAAPKEYLMPREYIKAQEMAKNMGLNLIK
ncbi:MAG: radical SAM protein [Sedimentisphaerales bacterium]|nr:radical SAM protein [Sedimentisphaerales bacterium]